MKFDSPEYNVSKFYKTRIPVTLDFNFQHLLDLRFKKIYIL